MIQIFNRSHYEDILVPTVEKLLDEEVIAKRYDDINNFEQMLSNENTVVLKFYLHISHKKQIEKLKERMEEPQKYWKHNDGDRDSSEKFDKYLEVYDQIFNKCSVTPWHIIPSNDKWYKVYLIAKVIVETLEQLDLRWPKLETEME
jgi:polyphosphate kinase 2 (PPK2 family)